MFKAKEKTRFCYVTIVLRNSFWFWFKKPFLNRLWSPISRQPLTAGAVWKFCVQEEGSSNKIGFQIFEILSRSELMLKISFKGNISNEHLNAIRRRPWIFFLKNETSFCIVNNDNFRDKTFEKVRYIDLEIKRI